MKPSCADHIRQVVRRAILTCFVLWSAALGLASVRAAALANPRLAKNHDAFFIENDFVYRRFLQLTRDGSYYQINSEHTAAAEVDRGTWSQEADGTVLLHFTRGGLRWHALLSGPLSIRLDDPQIFGALPAVADAIRRWLAPSHDEVFASDSIHELATAPVAIAVDPKAESFRRTDLETLVRQIDDFAWSEQHRTFRLMLTKPAGFPALLIPRGAVFDLADLAWVQSEYHVPRGQAPPFYFVQVDAGTFAREAGSWQKLP